MYFKTPERQLKKTNFKNGVNDLNKPFRKANIQVVYKHMKRCPTSLFIREMKHKTTMKYYHAPIRMAEYKKIDHTQCWQGYGALGPLYTAVGR